jgi:hypothetical protein
MGKERSDDLAVRGIDLDPIDLPRTFLHDFPQDAQPIQGLQARRADPIPTYFIPGKPVFVHQQHTIAMASKA